MKSNNYEKGLVFVIVFLFILINILPIINGKIDFSTINTIIYVDDDAEDGGTGASWSDAFKYLQDALAVANPYDEIHVAQGVYKPDQGGSQTPGDRYETFQLIDDVSILGGYAGMDAPNPDARNINTYKTVLSGDLFGDDRPGFENYSENSYNIIRGNYTQKTAVIDGFTITGGYADNNGYPANRWGGGIYNLHGCPTVKNCKFIYNYAWYGAGIYNVHHSSPIIINCSFIDNLAYCRGGGVGNFLYSDSTIINCVFINNSGLHWTGGGMHNYYSNITIINCIFNGNWADDAGGAICNYDYSRPSIFNTVFYKNTAPKGQALACDSQHLNSPSDTVFTNCIIWDGGNEFWNNDNSTINVAYSTIQSGWPGPGNIEQNPLFVDPDGEDNIPATEDDNLRLKPRSPCIDASDNSALPDDIFDLDNDGVTTEPLPVDLDYNPRFVDDPDTEDTGNGTNYIVDMGAYEYQDGVTNKPPIKPSITGDLSGVVGKQYSYKIAATDPEDDDILEYIVDWDDGSGYEIITGPFESGENVTVKHIWNEKGTYHIRAKAKDSKGLIGPEGTIYITMPRNRISKITQFRSILESFSDVFTFFQYLFRYF